MNEKPIWPTGQWREALKAKDAEIERLKDLARRLARGWDYCRCMEFGEPLSFGEEPIWYHWDMVKDPEVLGLFK
jgi:hypothetical protein